MGVIKGSADRVQPEVKKNFEESVKLLRRFADVDDCGRIPRTCRSAPSSAR